MDWSRLTRRFRRALCLPIRYARLDGPMRILLIRAAAQLGRHRLRLWLFPLRLPDAVEASRMPPAPSDQQPSPRAIAWAVNAGARVVPGSTCLVRALAAESLCRRFGYAARLRLGARRDSTGDLEAHAWLEVEGEVLVGGDGSPSEYSPFLPPRPARRGQPPQGP